MQAPFFQPWVGENYHTQTPKIMVLGESHYGKPEEYKPEWTQGVVKAWALGEQGTTRYFTIIAKILSNKAYDWISLDEKKTIWQQVAFYNYVQDFVGENPRIRPTPAMWTNAAEALRYVLNDLTPDIVIVTGRELAHHIKPVIDNYTGPARFCYWAHPSARSFKKDEAVAEFKKAQEEYAN